VNYYKHSQYIDAVRWRSILCGAAAALHGGVAAWGWLYESIGKVLDASRLAYNLLWTDFIELTAECAKLWAEVRELRSRNDSWAKELEYRAIRFAELEAERERTRGPLYVQPKVNLDDVTCHADGSMTLTARDQYGAELAQRRIPAMYQPPTPEPFICDVDFAHTPSDSTIVTIRQNGKIMYIMNINEARQQWKTQNLNKMYDTFNGTMANTFKYANSVDGRVGNAPQPTNRAHFEAWQKGFRGGHSLRRHGRPWRNDEVWELRCRYVAGAGLQRLALAFGREWEAILYKLTGLAGKRKAFGDNLDAMWMHFFTSAGTPLPTKEKREAALR